MEVPSSEMPPAPLYVLALKAAGRESAMAFAHRCDGDVAEIQRKIADSKRLVENGGPEMKPGAGPRIYRDAVLAGLDEALAVVDEMTRRGEAEDLDLALARRLAQAEGGLDAWRFAVEHWKDPGVIEAEIEADRLGAPIPAPEDRFAARIFFNHYVSARLEGLEAALSAVEKPSRGEPATADSRTREMPSSDSAPSALIVARTKAEGRCSALTFARRNEGEVADIRRKLVHAKRYVEEGAAEASPGMLRRAYEDAVLAGLDEALAVVDEMTRRGEEEDLDLALGRHGAEAEGGLDACLFALEHWRDPAAIEAKIRADRLGAPIPGSPGRPMSGVFSNYYTMGMLDGLKAALAVVGKPSPG